MEGPISSSGSKKRKHASTFMNMMVMMIYDIWNPAWHSNTLAHVFKSQAPYLVLACSIRRPRKGCDTLGRHCVLRRRPNFVRGLLIFVGPRCGNCFMSPSWYLEFWKIQGDTKNGNFWKKQQKLTKSKKKNYWQKLNHYNLPFNIDNLDYCLLKGKL